MKKEKEITAVLLGAGNFGRHYARIISGLNGKSVPGIPRIKTLVLTKTRRENAAEMAEKLRLAPDCRVDRVIGEKVAGPEDAADLLARYKPGFTAIAARDPKTGDSIHADYSAIALKYGAVLCEKPFSDARGDGASLKNCGRLFSYGNAGLFGLGLPMTAVFRQMEASGLSEALFGDASHIKVLWETLNPRNIVNNLAVHPWSLIAEAFEIESASIGRHPNETSVQLRLASVYTGKPATCEIVLRGGSRRSIRAGNRHIRMETRGTNTRLMENGQVLMETENPLEKNIIAVLKGKPLAGLKHAYESQLFLEKLHGYNP